MFFLKKRKKRAKQFNTQDNQRINIQTKFTVALNGKKRDYFHKEIQRI